MSVLSLGWNGKWPLQRMPEILLRRTFQLWWSRVTNGWPTRKSPAGKILSPQSQWRYRCNSFLSKRKDNRLRKVSWDWGQENQGWSLWLWSTSMTNDSHFILCLYSEQMNKINAVSSCKLPYYNRLGSDIVIIWLKVGHRDLIILIS